MNIPLTQGKVAIVDDIDADFLLQWKWCAMKHGSNFYAVRRGRKGESPLVFMHRAIMLPLPNQVVDHRDMNGLNNSRSNLRTCSHSDNAKNSKTRISSKSGYKGVHWFSDTRKWRAQIRANGRLISLGLFSDVTEAASAYDSAAIVYFGEYARLNFPAQEMARLSDDIGGKNTVMEEMDIPPKSKVKCCLLRCGGQARNNHTWQCSCISSIGPLRRLTTFITLLWPITSFATTFGCLWRGVYLTKK